MKRTLALSFLIGLGGFFWYWTAQQPEALRTSGAMEALQYWTAQRAYPNATLPKTGWQRGFKEARAMQDERIHKRQVAPWESMGPHNGAGRMLAIAFNQQNPNTLWAGSASGGLWRTHTGGVGAKAWHYVRTGFPVLGVAAVAVAPNDSNVVYIGTGEVYGYQSSTGGVTIRTTRGSYGIGILKTTDNGQTWTHVLDWSREQQRGVQMIRIDPQNPNTVWAATSEGIYVSRDAGASWTLSLDVLMGTDIAINPQNPDIVFVACGNLGSAGTGVYRTTDGGQTWTQMAINVPNGWSGGKAILSMYPQDPNIIYASLGTGSTSSSPTWLVRTNNGGQSWQVVSNQNYAVYQGWFAHYVGVHPQDPETVICAGVDIWKSTDGGQSLTQKAFWYKWNFYPQIGGSEGPPDYAHADHHAMVFHPNNPNMVYFATDGGIFRSRNAGETFEGVNGGLQTVQFYNGTASSHRDSSFAMGGLQDNSTILYDGTKRWLRTIGGDGSWTAIHPQNDRRLWGSAQRLAVLASMDGGQTWESFIPQEHREGASFIAPFVIAPSDPDYFYAGSIYAVRARRNVSGWIWGRTNGGQPLDGNPIVSMAVAPTDHAIVYAGTAPVGARAGLFRTLDTGETWTNVTGDLPDRYPMDLAVHPQNPGIAYVVFSGFDAGHVYRTSDYGSTWQAVSAGLPQVPANAVLIDPMFPQVVYIGNDLGVFVSENEGQTWTAFNDGLPDAIIAMDLTFSAANRKIRVATHGNGMYQRPMIEPSTPPPPAPTSLTLNPNYPNPFREFTTLSYTLVEPAQVNLAVYDVQGRLVQTLQSNFLQAGTYTATFRPADLQMASGVYVYRLVAGEQATTRTMTYIQ